MKTPKYTTVRLPEEDADFIRKVQQRYLWTGSMVLRVALARLARDLGMQPNGPCADELMPKPAERAGQPKSRGDL